MLSRSRSREMRPRPDGSSLLSSAETIRLSATLAKPSLASVSRYARVSSTITSGSATFCGVCVCVCVCVCVFVGVSTHFEAETELLCAP
jgi:hypothetical protein